MFPIIYVLLKNLFVDAFVSLAHQVQAQMQQIQQQQQMAQQVPINKDISGLSGLSPPLNS
jgi:hypothetical protein